MTDQRSQAEIVRQSLKRRYRKERRFRAYGIMAIAIALGALLILFTDIIGKGYTGFVKTTITMDVQLDGEMMYLDDPTDERQIKMADFVEPLVQALIKEWTMWSHKNMIKQLSLIFCFSLLNNLCNLWIKLFCFRDARSARPRPASGPLRCCIGRRRRSSR